MVRAHVTLAMLITMWASMIGAVAWPNSHARGETAAPQITAGQDPAKAAGFDEADELWAKKQWDTAVQRYRQIVQRRPDAPEAAKAHRQIGLYEKFSGKFGPAMQHLRKAAKAIEDKREAADTTTSIACVHHLEGDYDQAIATLESVLAETTDWDQVKYCSYWIREAKRQRDCLRRSGGTEVSSCAADALRIAAQLLGREIDETEVAAALPADSEGHSMQQLIDAAAALDLPNAFGVSLTFDELKEITPPAILLMSPAHYAVLQSNSDELHLQNPIRKGMKENVRLLGQYAHRWTGYAVLFNIGDNARFCDGELDGSALQELKGRTCYCCPAGNLGGPEDNANTRFAREDSVAGCATGGGMPRLQVNTVNLNFLVQDTDLAYSGVGPSVVFQRTYNADSANERVFGRGWMCNYEMRVDETPSGDVYLRRPTGGTHTFRSRYDGTYDPPSGVHDTLIKNEDGSWRLREKGSKSTFHFDASGRLARIEDRNVNSLSLQYTGERLTAIVDAAGRQTILTYNEAGHVISLQDPLGRVVAYGYNESGDLTSVTDMAETTVTYAYDQNAYMTAINTPNGTTAISFAMGSEGYALQAITDPLGNTKRYDTYGSHYTVRIRDGLDRATYYDNNSDGSTRAVRDHFGNATQFGYDGNGNLVSITDARGGTSQLGYDERGNVVSATDTLGNTASLTYDGNDNLVSVTDPLGRVTTFEHDERFNLTRIVDALNREAGFTYDPRGLLASVTNPRGAITQFSYDAAGNLASVTDPLGRAQTYRYDAVGRVITRTSPDGVTVNLTYDGLGRVLSAQYPDGTVSYTYDCCQLTSVTGKDNTEMHFSYDEANRLTQVVEANGFAIGYEYDVGGYRTAIIYPGDKRVTYTYDEAGRLTAVTDWLGNTTGYTYDESGRLTAVSYANGTGTSYEYDSAGRMTRLTNNGVEGQPLPGFAYTLDEVGNRTRIEYFNMDLPEPQISDTTYTYDAADQILTAGETTFAHNARGNLIRESSPTGVTTYTYDFNDMLTRVTAPQHTYNYGYDARGHRIWREVDGQRELHIVDMNRGLWQVIAHADANGEITEYFIYGLGLVSRIDADANAYYYHYDGIGSTVAITDQAGQLVARYAYAPFGEVTLADGAEWNRFQYTGGHGVADEKNGVLFMRARYYSASLGRFSSPDPLLRPLSDPAYPYSSNNPIIRIDPSGKQVVEATVVIVVTTALVVYGAIRLGQSLYEGYRNIFSNFGDLEGTNRGLRQLGADMGVSAMGLPPPIDIVVQDRARRELEQQQTSDWQERQYGPCSAEALVPQ